MHYFPSTYLEIAEAIHRRRTEAVMQGIEPDRLRCVWGRMQIRQFEDYCRTISTYACNQDPTAGTMRFLGVEVLFDQRTPWRFDFIEGTKKPGTASP